MARRQTEFNKLLMKRPHRQSWRSKLHVLCARLVGEFRDALPLIVGATLLIAFGGYQLSQSPWSVSVTLRHWMAAPNCGAAQARGLDKAQRGQPGYYRRHDRDRDGIACEPYLQ